MLWYPTLRINKKRILEKNSTRAKEVCTNWSILSLMELLIIGMICSFCGNMLSLFSKYHLVSVLFCWLKLIWIRQSTRKKWLKYFSKSSRFLQFMWLFRVYFRCKYVLMQLCNWKINGNCAWFWWWSYSCDSSIWRILIISQLWEDGLGGSRCHSSSSKFVEKKWNKLDDKCLIWAGKEY